MHIQKLKETAVKSETKEKDFMFLKLSELC